MPFESQLFNMRVKSWTSPQSGSAFSRASPSGLMLRSIRRREGLQTSVLNSSHRSSTSQSFAAVATQPRRISGRTELSRAEDSEHKSNQLMVLIMTSLQLLTLPYSITHPEMWMVLPVALAFPLTGKALRPIVKEAATTVSELSKWYKEHSNTPSLRNARQSKQLHRPRRTSNTDTHQPRYSEFAGSHVASQNPQSTGSGPAQAPAWSQPPEQNQVLRPMPMCSMTNSYSELEGVHSADFGYIRHGSGSMDLSGPLGQRVLNNLEDASPTSSGEWDAAS